MGPFDKILTYEAHELPNDEAVEMFQQLVDSGTIWQLPDDYLDIAAILIERGVINSGSTRAVH